LTTVPFVIPACFKGGNPGVVPAEAGNQKAVDARLRAAGVDAEAGMTLFPETASSSHLARVSDRSLVIATVQLRNPGIIHDPLYCNRRSSFVKRASVRNFTLRVSSF
jgi:hypothetical protein